MWLVDSVGVRLGGTSENPSLSMMHFGLVCHPLLGVVGGGVSLFDLWFRARIDLRRDPRARSFPVMGGWLDFGIVLVMLFVEYFGGGFG